MSFIVALWGFLLTAQIGKHFFFPFSYLSGIRIDYMAPTLYGADFITIVFAIYLLTRWRSVIVPMRPFFKTYWLSVSIALMCLVINGWFSLSKELWMYSLARIVQWIVVFLFFSYSKNRTDYFRSLLIGIACGALIQLVLAILQLASRHSMQGIFYWLGERRFSIHTPGIAKSVIMGKEFLRPYGTFSHPNSLAGFYLLLFAFVRTQKRIANQPFRSFLLFIFSALILISFSRTAIVAYVILLLVYYVKDGPGCRICVLGKYAVLLFLFLFAASISGDRQSLEKRTDFTQKSIAIIARAPLTGTGLGGYLIAQHTYPQKFPVFFEQPVHSITLLATAQLGLPLATFVFLFICGYVGKKIKNPEVLLPLLAVGITGLFDHYWLTLPQNLFLSATLFGILISIYEKQATGD